MIQNYNVTSEKHKVTLTRYNVTSSEAKVMIQNYNVTSEKHKVTLTRYNVTSSEAKGMIQNYNVTSEKHKVTSPEHKFTSSEAEVMIQNYNVTSEKHKVTSTKYNVTSLELSNTTAQPSIKTAKSIVHSKLTLLENKSTSNSKVLEDNAKNKAAWLKSSVATKLQKYTIPSPLAVTLIPTLLNRYKISARAYSTETDGDSVMTHLDKHGKARMVDVGDKPVTSRVAEAQCYLRVGGRLLRLLRDARLPKGDALTVAQIAGVVGAKKTADLIPMCHPLSLDCVRIKIELPKEECDDGGDIKVHCEVRVTSKTGAEMEALTGASVAALALYDMCKSVDKYMKITDLKVVRKSGGRSGDWPKESVPEDVKIRDYNKTPIKPKETYAPTNMMYF